MTSETYSTVIVENDGGKTDAPMGRQHDFVRIASYLKIPVAVLFLGALCLSILSFFNPDFTQPTLLSYSMFLIALHLWGALKSGSVERKAPLFAFLGGTLLSMGIAVMACVYFLGPFDYVFGKYVWVTFILLLLSVLGALSGSTVADLLWAPRKNMEVFSLYGKKVDLMTLAVFGAGWCLMVIGMYVTGGFSARWNVGNRLSETSSLYVVAALTNMCLPFFALLGASCERRLLCAGNFVRVGILAICALIFGMSGGREYSVRYGVYFLIGVLYSQIPMKYFKWLFLVMFSGALLFIYVIGAARAMDRFGESSVSDRFFMVAETLSASDEEEDAGEGAALLLLTRIAEPSAQKVIDDVTETQYFIGIENLDRLAYLYLPKFVMPNKPNMDDGFDRLVERHGFLYTTMTTAPITLIADSYERGGYVGTFVIAMFISVVLILYARAFFLIPSPILRLTFFAHFVVTSLRFYSYSLTGILTMLLYYLPKDFFLISLVFLAARLIPGRERKRHLGPIKKMAS